MGSGDKLGLGRLFSSFSGHLLSSPARAGIGKDGARARYGREVTWKSRERGINMGRPMKSGTHNCCWWLLDKALKAMYVECRFEHFRVGVVPLNL